MSQAETTAPILIKEREDGILIARMNRPERMNALGGGLREALEAAWFEFRDDDALKVMIITGVGDRAFCAGADLRENDKKARELGAQSAQALLDAQRSAAIAPSFTGNNFHLYKPVIAAINGWCLAGGCEMAMGCDMRIIERHAKMGLPEVKRGMGAKATTHKLHFLTYLASGLEIVWTGDPVTAQRAVELGLANEVVPTGQSVERARAIARDMCRRPLQYVRYHKERFFQSIGVPLDYALAMEQRFPPHETEAYREGLKASLAAKLPGWPAN
ncbi:MAG: enoyl-CoA hydratase/isomerase family protein [Betaproteobacteria bacterium]|nr:enoyl-CoA hydratase/isomerase family protein [Betaproteobacteria bacterium]